jgi:cobalamin-dependent methionine synthase I
MKLTYSINELVPYINWLYFYHAWGVSGQSETVQQQLRQEAEERLQRYDGCYHVHALFELFHAYSDGDDLMIEGSDTIIPLLRQQQEGSEHLCLADFIAPHTPSTIYHSPSTTLGLFATSVDIGMETDFDADPYEKMMAQLLADRLAEAAAEVMHRDVRTHYWGYAPDEKLSVSDLHAERFLGIRPAVGYPSLPDVSLNFVIDRLLGGLNQIGIRLTESGAMKPHASVSGLMFSHPKAHYFSIGKIGEDQLRDYARRRGLPLETMRIFLSANL